MSGQAKLITKESKIHDAQIKKIGEHMGELYGGNYTWYKSVPDYMIIEKYGKKTQGCEPDGGIFCFDGLPQVSFEAKFQGQDGQAGYALEYEKMDTLSVINPSDDHVLFCAGMGCLGNPDSKSQKKMGVFNTFAYNIKIEYDNRILLNTYVYQRVEGFTDQEVVDIMKKHLDIKRGLSENIVIPSSICTGYECLSSPLRGKLDL